MGTAATINSEDNVVAEVRDLRVVTSSTDQQYGVGIRSMGASSATSFRNLVIDATMADTGAIGTTDLRVWGMLLVTDAVVENVVVNATGTAFAYGIWIDGSSTVDDASLMVTATNEAIGMPVGAGEQRVSDTVIVANGDARSVGVEAATPASKGIYTNLDARASESATIAIGFNAVDSSPEIRDSLLLGATFSIGHQFNGSPKVANTVLQGPRVATATCINVMNGDFVANSC